MSDDIQNKNIIIITVKLEEDFITLSENTEETRVFKE